MILTINNSYSRLLGLTSAQLKELKESLSYTVGGSKAYFSGRGVYKRYLINNKGEFTTGLLPRVLAWVLPQKKFELRDLRVRPTTNCKELAHLDAPHVPYNEQLEAINSCVACDRGIVSAVTGFGKSYVMALLVQKLQLRTLIIVPNLELKRQLTADFTNYFGNLKNITIENIDNPNLKNHKKYDILLVDEAHHSAAKTYRMLNKNAWKNIFYRFFFTATPYRSDAEEQILMESVTGPVIYEISYTQARDKGYVVPVEAYYLESPRVVVTKDTWHGVYSEIVTNNVQRNQLLANTLLAINASGASTLCLVREIEHGRVLSELTGFPFASGEGQNTKELLTEFNNSRIKTLIGTTGVLGEGVDTKPCEYVIIAGLGKAKGQFMQNIGRGLRKYDGKYSCKIIIIQDRSHAWAVNHFNTQKRILKEEYGVKAVAI